MLFYLSSLVSRLSLSYSFYSFTLPFFIPFHLSYLCCLIHLHTLYISSLLVFHLSYPSHPITLLGFIFFHVVFFFFLPIKSLTCNPVLPPYYLRPSYWNINLPFHVLSSPLLTSTSFHVSSNDLLTTYILSTCPYLPNFSQIFPPTIKSSYLFFFFNQKHIWYLVFHLILYPRVSST